MTNLRAAGMIGAIVVAFIAAVTWALGKIDVVGPEQMEGIAPVRVVSIEVSPEGQASFFSRLEEFAEEWDFTLTIRNTMPNFALYLVVLERSDVRMLGTNIAVRNTYRLGVYQHRGGPPVAEELANELVTTLTATIAGLEGVVVARGGQ